MMNTELVKNKLSLMENLIILANDKNKPAFRLFTKKDSPIDIHYHTEICNSLIETIKKSNDELWLEKYNSKSADNNPSEKDIKECISALRIVSNQIMDAMRKVDNLKPEPNNSLALFSIPRDVEKSKSTKISIMKEYNSLLINICNSVKNLILKLENISEIKRYDFDIDFADYYLNILSRDIKKEKDFHNDVIAMNGLYKKIYKIIEQLEKLERNLFENKSA